MRYIEIKGARRAFPQLYNNSHANAKKSKGRAHRFKRLQTSPSHFNLVLLYYTFSNEQFFIFSKILRSIPIHTCCFVIILYCRARDNRCCCGDSIQQHPAAAAVQYLSLSLSLKCSNYSTCLTPRVHLVVGEGGRGQMLLLSSPNGLWSVCLYCCCC